MIKRRNGMWGTVVSAGDAAVPAARHTRGDIRRRRAGGRGEEAAGDDKGAGRGRSREYRRNPAVPGSSAKVDGTEMMRGCGARDDFTSGGPGASSESWKPGPSRVNSLLTMQPHIADRTPVSSSEESARARGSPREALHAEHAHRAPQAGHGRISSSPRPRPANPPASPLPRPVTPPASAPRSAVETVATRPAVSCGVRPP